MSLIQLVPATRVEAKPVTWKISTSLGPCKLSSSSPYFHISHHLTFWISYLVSRRFIAAFHGGSWESVERKAGGSPLETETKTPS
jgi:hypothetical protein